MPKPELARDSSRRGRSLVTRDHWDITYSQLETVVALLSAERVGKRGVLASELGELGISNGAGLHIAELERRRWAVCVGKTATGGKLWLAHPRSWSELGFERERVSA